MLDRNYLLLLLVLDFMSIIRYLLEFEWQISSTNKFSKDLRATLRLPKKTKDFQEGQY